MSSGTSVENQDNEAHENISQKMSDVWKNKNNVNKDGVRLDLVAHLRRQRQIPSWMRAKQKFVRLLVDELLPRAIRTSTNPTHLSILNMGCGVGEDDVDMVNALVSASSTLHSLVVQRLRQLSAEKGLQEVDEEKVQLSVKWQGGDINEEVLDYAKSQVEEFQKKEQPPNTHIQLSFLQADITKELSKEGEGYDIVMASNMLVHVSNYGPDKLRLALTQLLVAVRRGGLVVTLEGGSPTLICDNDRLLTLMEKITPSKETSKSARKKGGVGFEIYFELKDSEEVSSVDIVETYSILHNRLAADDPNWLKLDGLLSLALQHKLLSEEEAKEYRLLFTSAAEQGRIMNQGLLVCVCAEKKNN